MVTVGLDDSAVPGAVSIMKAEIQPGETSRKELNETLGNPIVSSESWKLEVYRADYEDYVSYWAGIASIPYMPAWFETLEEKVFLLVTYDQNWTVKEFDTGHYAEGGIVGRNGQTKDAEAGGLLLNIQDQFGNYDPAYEWLYAPESETPSILKTTSAEDHCTLFLTLDWPSAKVRVFLDEELVWDKRDRLQHGFLALTLLAGNHVIKVLPSGSALVWMDYKGELREEVNCQSGQSQFVEIQSKIVWRDSFFERNTLTGSVRVTNVASQHFEDGRLILYHNGKWLGPDKPSQ